MFPKSGSATSGVEHENKGDGMATDGLRTERVTLEITREAWRSPRPTSSDDWSKAAREAGIIFLPGESVRVVKETHFDDLAQVAMERDAAIRERDELRRALTVENDHALRIKAERDAAIREREALKALVDKYENDDDLVKERSQLKARVAELEAASGGGDGEAVAYFVKWADKDWGVQNQTFRTLERAQDYIKDEKSEDENPQIVPLYASPPQPRGWLTEEEQKELEEIAALLQGVNYLHSAEFIRSFAARSSPPEQPRGWLTEEEREVMSYFREACQGQHERAIGNDSPRWGEIYGRRAAILERLLARSSPPEVVLPKSVNVEGPGALSWHEMRQVVVAALAEIGVVVKEVG
jgi:hypothetical protein